MGAGCRPRAAPLQPGLGEREGKSLSRAAPPSAAPARPAPGAAGLTAFSCSSRSFILAPEAGERVPGELAEVATRPGRAGSWRRRWAAAAAAG